MFIRSFIESILKYAHYILFSLVLLTVIFAYCAFDLKFDSSIDVWFLENDPTIAVYQEFLDRFEADEIVVMGVFAPDVFSADVLASIKRITDTAQKAPHALRVHSLTNLRVPTVEDDNLSMHPLIFDLPQTEKERELIRKQALANRVVQGLVTQDSQATAIIVELDPKGNSFEGKVALTQSLRMIVAKEKSHVSISLTGSPPIDEAFYLYSMRDLKIVVPLVALVILIILLIFIRQLTMALIPFVIVIQSCVWLLGIMAILGINLNILSSGVLAVVLAIGVADAIHVITGYLQELMLGRSKRNAIMNSFRSLLLPCFLTSVTTIVGMLSLQISNLQPVREFGYLAALGVFIAFILSLILIPILLHYINTPKDIIIHRMQHGWFTRCLHCLAKPKLLSSSLIVGLTLILVVISLLSLSSLRVGTNVFNYFRANDPIRIETERVESKIGGSAAVEFVIQTKEDGLHDPQLLKQIESFQEWLKQIEGVTYVVSVVDELKELNRVYSDFDKDKYILPTTRQEIAQFMLVLAAEEDFARFVQDNNSVARISVRAQFNRSDQLVHMIPMIEEELTRQLGQTNKVFFTGFIKLMSDMEGYLLDSQIKSISLALFLIICLMGLLFRSIKFSFMSIIPNVLPILFGLSFMAWMTIDLDPGTVMIGSIALGLVIDDTVHFLVRYKRHRDCMCSLEDSITKTLLEIGRPIIITSLVLACGFLVMLFGSFAPNRHFGLISAYVIMIALIADLILLPAALIVTKRFFSDL
ncbi:MAG: MMPL family transporter [bacterium]|nr:MMPL family transporter [bacterium]MBU1918997.1 MMPL family transporter [bacterium]